MKEKEGSAGRRRETIEKSRSSHPRKEGRKWWPWYVQNGLLIIKYLFGKKEQEEEEEEAGRAAAWEAGTVTKKVCLILCSSLGAD